MGHQETRGSGVAIGERGRGEDRAGGRAAWSRRRWGFILGEHCGRVGASVQDSVAGSTVGAQDIAESRSLCFLYRCTLLVLVAWFIFRCPPSGPLC